jgi:hypothetical protein
MYNFSLSASLLRAISNLAVQEVTGYKPYLVDQLLREAEDPKLVDFVECGRELRLPIFYNARADVSRAVSIFVYEFGPKSRLRIDIFYECVNGEPGRHLKTLFGIVSIAGGPDNRWGSIIPNSKTLLNSTLLATFTLQPTEDYTPSVDITPLGKCQDMDFHDFFGRFLK